MVKLKNIKRNNSIVECDIIPEDSSDSGHIVVNLDSGKLEDFFLPAGYEWCMSHVDHAKNNLIALVKEEHLSKEKLVMWY